MTERPELPLILGEAPGPNGGTYEPLGLRTARRLCLMAGWKPEEGDDPYRTALSKRFELRNLLDYSPPKKGKGMTFPMEDARWAAESLCLGGRTVVALGRRVGAALHVRGDYFCWREAQGVRVVMIPHPSGIVRNWNDPYVVKRAGEVLREVGGS